MFFIIFLVIFDIAFIIYVVHLVVRTREENYLHAKRPRHAHISVFDESDETEEEYIPSSRQSRLAQWKKNAEAVAHANAQSEKEINDEAEARQVDNHRRNMFAG